MPHLGQRDLDALHELIGGLQTIRLGEPSNWPQLVGQLRDLLRGEFCGVFRLSNGHDKWDVEFMHQSGLSSADEVLYRAHVRQNAVAPVLYDPVRPQRAQRNVVLTRERLQALVKAPDAKLPDFVCSSDTQPDQLRVLACDGPLLLAWIGGTRTDPFTWREVQILRAILPACRERLMLERQITLPMTSSLPVILEEIPTAAFVLSVTDGCLQIEHANSSGTAALAREGESLRRDLSEAVRRSDGDQRFRVKALAANGLSSHHLAVERRPVDPRGRVALAARRWALTPKQVDVLDLLVLGHSNRTLSELLRCSERTIELHVSTLLARTGSDSRSHLVARVWMLAEP